MGTGWFALVARRSLRRRLGSHALVAAVVTLGFGVSIGAVAVADATDRAYPDYVRDAHVNPLVVNPSVATPEIAAAIRGFDGVSAVHTDDMFLASFAAAEPGTLPELLAGPHSQDELWLQVRGSVDGRYADTDRPAVTEGRLPTGSHELFVSDQFRRSLEQIVEHPVELGDELDLAFWPAGLDRTVADPSRVAGDHHGVRRGRRRPAARDRRRAARLARVRVRHRCRPDRRGADRLGGRARRRRRRAHPPCRRGPRPSRGADLARPRPPRRMRSDDRRCGV